MTLTEIIKIKSFSGKDAIYIEENNDLKLFFFLRVLMLRRFFKLLICHNQVFTHWVAALAAFRGEAW